MTSSARNRRRAWLQLVAAIVALLLLLVLIGDDLLDWRQRHAGIESGWSRRQPPIEHPRYLVNTELDGLEPQAMNAQLEAIRANGIETIRQRFAWEQIEPQPGQFDWAWSDALLAAAEANDLRVLAVLDTSPAWARPDGEQDNRWTPPSDMADYAAFCHALAARYGERIAAYQVWDQPNIRPHWGLGAIDPGGYVEMLRAAAGAIRPVAPQATIVAAGLAPNGEWAGRNMSDRRFLQEMYRLEAQDSFDVAACKAYGFWSGPDDRRLGDEILNFSHAILLRREMVRHGDAATPLWSVEGDWCALPADWKGEPAPLGSDLPAIQSQRLLRALERVNREWPWMGMVAVGVWRPAAEINDPAWGYALTTPEDQPSVLGQAITSTLHHSAMRRYDPGRHALLPDTQGEIAHDIAFSFWGTSLALWVDAPGSDGEIAVRIDGVEHSARYRADQRSRRLVLARGLPLDTHFCTLSIAPKGPTIRDIQVGAQRSWLSLGIELATALLIAALLLRAALSALSECEWRALWRSIHRAWSRLPASLQIGSVLAGYALTMAAPWGSLRLVGLLLYGASSLLRPDIALLTAIWSIPFAPLRVRLGPGSFGPTEISVLIAAGAAGWHWLVTEPDQRPTRAKRWHMLDWTILALVVVSIASCFWAEYQHEALRELREMILEPALLYLLLRQRPLDPERDGRWSQMLIASGVALALYALVIYPTAGGVIEAEGVRRARAFYGSPNNLALMLERLIPMALAFCLWSTGHWRRWCHGLGAGLMVLALLLSFSRGAILIGLPIGLGVLLLLKGGRTRWIILALLALGLIAMIPLMRTERFSSLLDLSSGTAFVRTNLWHASIEMVRDHPILGLGLDNFLYYYGDYAREGALVDRWLNHPHNIVLDFWLRLGSAGLAVLLTMVVAWTRSLCHIARQQIPSATKALVAGLAVGLLAAVAHGLIDASFFVTELAYWMLFASALLANESQRWSSRR